MQNTIKILSQSSKWNIQWKNGQPQNNNLVFLSLYLISGYVLEN